MKRGIVLSMLAVCLWMSALSGTAFAEEASGWTEHRSIAHAMGAIGGAAYTNSYEAFVVNYERGHRVFEVDLILTEDGKLAARHDWEPYLAAELQQNLPEDRLGVALNIKEFKRTEILNRYSPLSFRDIVKLMQQYPDVYIVTDTKETDLDLVRRQFQYIKDTAAAADLSVLNRLIPEIYSQNMYKAVMDIYPFPNKLYSLYLSSEAPEETVRFVQEQGIDTVAMPVERAEQMPELVASLHNVGVKTYVHSVNDTNEMGKLEQMGVYGIYTDYLPGGDPSSGKTDLASLASSESAPAIAPESPAPPKSLLSKAPLGFLLGFGLMIWMGHKNRD